MLETLCGIGLGVFLRDSLSTMVPVWVRPRNPLAGKLLLI